MGMAAGSETSPALRRRATSRATKKTRRFDLADIDAESLTTEQKKEKDMADILARIEEE